MAKAQKKFGFQGTLVREMELDGLIFTAGDRVEFGPYDTVERRDAEAKRARVALREEPQMTVILTCSSVTAVVDIAKAAQLEEQQRLQAEADPQTPVGDRPEDTSAEDARVAAAMNAKAEAEIAKTEQVVEAAKPAPRRRKVAAKQ